ncbi:ABC transporter permease [Ornithinimicrobium cerasi]|uniref:ABC transporter permease n=1 Tax=Ornithinimicrobium cerasi TaxID=2248773 RepID=UPI000F001AE9|nr:ABC transporter permease [Ornithinimicrobium cerasi]
MNTTQVRHSGVALSEAVKLLSLRSSGWLLATTALLILGLGAFTAIGTTMADIPTPEGVTFDPVGGSLTGISAAELVAGALGGLFVTGEYATHMVRSTFSAVPRRWPVVAAKALVVAVAIFLVAAASTLLAFAASALVLGGHGLSLSLGDPGVLRALLGSAMYLALIGVFGVALGWLLRSTAGVLTALVGLLYVLPIVGVLLPRPVSQHIIPFLPNNAGTAVMQFAPSALLPPWVGLALFTAYALLTLAIAALVILRHDA